MSGSCSADLPCLTPRHCKEVSDKAHNEITTKCRKILNGVGVSYDNLKVPFLEVAFCRVRSRNLQKIEGHQALGGFFSTACCSF